MLRVSKLTDYATEVMAVLAAAPARVHNAQELAERARLEAPTVSKLLKQLAQAGLVESFRGVNGGYFSPRPPRRGTPAAPSTPPGGPTARSRRRAWSNRVVASTAVIASRARPSGSASPTSSPRWKVRSA
mgnify:CR=1 FL=1